MRPRVRPSVSDYLLLHLIVLIWGITAIIGKLVSLDPAILTAWRTGIAAIAVAMIVVAGRGKIPPLRDTLLMLGMGLLIGLHWFLFFLSARLGTVSGSLAGVSTMALWVALLEPLMIRGRRWSGAEGLLAGGVIMGVLIIPSQDPGFLTGILAAGVAAIFAIVNARLVQRYPALVITGLEMASACAFSVAGAFLLGSDDSLQWWPTPRDWPYVLVLSLACTVFAYSACIWLQRRISTFSIGMTSNLEPIYGMALAPLVFGVVEHQPWQFYLGSGVIIACVALHTFLTTRRSTSRAETDLSAVDNHPAA